MADDNSNGIDWGSLAASVLPAVIGGALGARGGVGPINGAVLGMGNYASQSIGTEFERQKLNADIATRNATIAEAQQRTSLENQRLGLEKQNYDRMDRIAAIQAQNYQQEMQQRQIQIDSATKTQQGQDQFRQSLPPDKQAEFDADPNKSEWIAKYNAQQDWQTRVNNARDTLVKAGLDPATATMLGPQGTAHLLGTIEASKRQPKEPYAIHYDATTGTVIQWNKATGAFQTFDTGKGRNANVPPEKAEADLLRIWKAQNPNNSLMADQGDLGPFYNWRSSDEGQLAERFAYGELNPQQFRGALSSLRQQNAATTTAAMQKMRESNPNMTDQQFQDYMKTPKAGPMLEQWKDYVRQQGRGPSIPTGPAANPAPKAKQPIGKRPSLDSIFGG